jgi:hypothetical protein
VASQFGFVAASLPCNVVRRLGGTAGKIPALRSCGACCLRLAHTPFAAHPPIAGSFSLAGRSSVAWRITAVWFVK